METVLVRAIVVVSLVLVLLVLVYLGYRLRERMLASAVEELIASLGEVDDRLGPLVFTGSSDYNRTAANLLAQSRHLQHRLSNRGKSSPSVSQYREMVDTFQSDVDIFFRDTDNDILSDRRGAILKGFVSEIDNSLQTYSVHVPWSYLGERAFTLVVHLHGHGWFRPFQGHPALALPGAIVLSPEGRRASDYMWIGEEDVLRAIDEVKRDYLIDESRVFVSGTSMGGTGAWNLAVHYPHLFAGVAPRAANCDFRAWEKRWGWNQPLRGQHEELREYLLESDSPITYIRNLAATPTYVVHAAADTVVPVEHSRAAVRILREAGAPVEYREYLVGHHGDFPKHVVHDSLAWLAAHPRRSLPEKYHFETRSVRHGRGYFVSISQLAEVLKPATIDVSVENGTLLVRTSNVLALSVDTTDLPPVVRLKLDDTTLPLPREGKSPLHFLKNARAWRPIEQWPPDETPRKMQGVEGPVQNVLLAPFVVVVGTGGGEEWSEAAEAEGSRFVDEWFRRYGAKPPLIDDTKVTDDLLSHRNVIFFGRPRDDSLMKDVLEKMPIKVTADAVELNGERFTGNDVGTIFCHPTPGKRGRMVAVLTALSPDALYQVWTRFGNWFNWGIHDHRKWFDYCVYDANTVNPETYPVVGFFGTDWSFARGRFWRPTDDALARARPQGVPKHASAPEVDTLYLSDLKPDVIDQMRGAVGFDRSYRGNAIVVDGTAYDRGLGVRCPSSIEYSLDGAFSKLSAVVGFTTEPEEAFSVSRFDREMVKFVVIGDGKVLHVEPIDWEIPSAEIDVDVRGVETLTLKVRSAGGALWLHGSSAWADVKLRK